MAPSAIDTFQELPERKKNGDVKRNYLTPSGSLDSFHSEDLTPIIGTELPEANIVEDFLNSPDGDRRLRDLAIKISERGVVFFRAQDNLTDDLQKKFIQRLGELSGKPSTSGLHIHPIHNDQREFGSSDPQISTINSVERKQLKLNAAIWHSDISFEPVPADYTSLRLTELPRTGGDTLWASGYEIFDRISQPYQRFLETLDVTHIGQGFHDLKARGTVTFYEKERGSPENFGPALQAVHPLVRTNPVTGWKSLYAVGPFPRYINGVSKDESERLLKWFHDLVIYNHDLQVRFKWKQPNDIAIWDNRSVFHSATNDYDGFGERSGNRAVGIGEKPFFDPDSQSRREALGETYEVPA